VLHRIVLSGPRINHAVVAPRRSRCEFCDTVGTMPLHSLGHNVAAVRAEIAAAAIAAGRKPEDIELIAVAKTQPAAAIRAAAAAGCRAFGENYPAEAAAKQDELGVLPVSWHFIGAIQSNKPRMIAERFDWIHTVAREKIARRLSEQAPSGRELNICLQVNVDRDPNKAGIGPEEAAELLERVQALPNLSVRGLMTILHPDSPPLAGYLRLAELFESLRPLAPKGWDTLSMGMSSDYREAIAAGATHVRVGTAIFGARRSAPAEPPSGH
jgi:pyridoxal phosphate enzyme (YggS family)